MSLVAKTQEMLVAPGKKSDRPWTDPYVYYLRVMILFTENTGCREMSCRNVLCVSSSAETREFSVRAREDSDAKTRDKTREDSLRRTRA
jgi:hypothetical protein